MTLSSAFLGPEKFNLKNVNPFLVLPKNWYLFPFFITENCEGFKPTVKMDDKGTIYLILNPKLLKLSFIFSLKKWWIATEWKMFFGVFFSSEIK